MDYNIPQVREALAKGLEYEAASHRCVEAAIKAKTFEETEEMRQKAQHLWDKAKHQILVARMWNDSTKIGEY